MLAMLARNWWALALRGLAAIVFGVMVFVWPEISLLVLVLWFGAYALVDGILAIVAAVRASGRQQRWGAILLEGIIGIVAGLVTLFWPGITALALVYVIAAWSILTGIFEIAAAIRLRREITGEWLLGLGGVASLLFGVLLMLYPGVGALALLWLIGAYALAFGVVLLLLAFRLRRWHHRQVHDTTERRAA
jgi:uncharacterized membrane protein HdeD (DUF308 family)